MSFLTVLQEMRTPFLDAFFLFCTHFGQEMFCLAILCALFWCIDKKLAYKIGFAFFISGIFVQLLKVSFRIERPWVRDPELIPVKGAIENATGYSFPSGHTQVATSLFGTLLFHTKRKGLALLYGLIVLLVGFSRMYLGVHTPADVVTSFLISIFLAAVISAFFERMYRAKSVFTISFLVCFLSVFLMYYSYTSFIRGLVEQQFISDCFKAAGAGIGFGTGYYFERSYIHFNEKSSHRFFQILKFIIGIVVLFGFRATFIALFGKNLPADFARYLLMSLWTIAFYPALLQKYFPSEAPVLNQKEVIS